MSEFPTRYRAESEFDVHLQVAARWLSEIDEVSSLMHSVVNSLYESGEVADEERVDYAIDMNLAESPYKDNNYWLLVLRHDTNSTEIKRVEIKMLDTEARLTIDGLFRFLKGSGFYSRHEQAA